MASHTGPCGNHQFVMRQGEQVWFRIPTSVGSGICWWSIVVQYLALGWFRAGEILACVWEFDKGRCLGMWALDWLISVSDVYLWKSSLLSIIPGRGSLSKIKASNARASRIQKTKYSHYTNDVDDLFMCVLTTCLSSLVKYIFQVLFPVFNLNFLLLLL